MSGLNFVGRANPSAVAEPRADKPDEPSCARLVGDDSPYHIRWRKVVCISAVALYLAGCTTPKAPPPPPPAPPVSEAPPAPREFRAAWVATVANIDWPSQPGLKVAQQRAEMIAILDKARALNLNAIILQVRPAADALYASELEPWSEYLTGVQGRAPEPAYDPLQAWIGEAHRRGLELHAWFNPYRARHHEAKSPLAASHIARQHPGLVKKYGEMLWLDPGEPAAAAHTLAVIRDVVRRYDVDGVHLDDYFYPYPVTKPLPPGAPKDAPAEEIDFPDAPSRRRYVAAGGQLARDEWRRDNVNRLVEEINRAVHGEKPWVKFGISPFGLGRPDRRPAGIKGFSQYDKLHADVELWMAKGWADYFVPQLYWPLNRPEQSFPVLLDYWLGQNKAGRHLWPGLFTSAISDEKKWTADDITRQIGLTRGQPGATGHVHFSMVALMDDRRGITGQLAPLYLSPALMPATTWLDATPPVAPLLKQENPGALTILPAAGEAAAHYAVWRKQGGVWNFSIQAAGETLVETREAEAIEVSSVDRSGNESARAVWRVPAPKKS